MTGAITAAMGPVLADPWRGHMGGTWMWLWVPLTIVLLVGVVGLVGVIVARGSSTSSASAPPAPERRAREILMERYARGEIDTEEFEERSARLR